MVHKYALDRLDSKRSVGALELYELRTLSVTQQREVLENSKRVARVGLSVCVVPSGRVIDSKS